MTDTTYSRDGDYVAETVTTDAQTAEIIGHIPARHLRLTVDDGRVLSDGSDTETLTVEVVSGLAVARGTSPSDADVLSVDDTAVVEVDGNPVSVDISDGSGSTTITTTKSAGSTISVVAGELSSYPAETDSAEIEVVSA